MSEHDEYMEKIEAQDDARYYEDKFDEAEKAIEELEAHIKKRAKLTIKIRKKYKEQRLLAVKYKKALEQYGKHSEICDTKTMRRMSANCICGFDEILDKTK